MRVWQGNFSSLSTFRWEIFDVEIALHQYHHNPVGFAAALHDVCNELCAILRQDDPASYQQIVAKSLSSQRRRDYYRKAEVGKSVCLTLRECFQLSQQFAVGGVSNILYQHWILPGLQKLLRLIGLPRSTSVAEAALPSWWSQYEVFRYNLHLFCKFIGSDTDPLETPEETINRLKQHSLYVANQKRELDPLFNSILHLTEQLHDCERVNAALRIRHTIEHLVAELPQKAPYRIGGANQKWQTFWKRMWKDAKKNVNNPLHELRNTKGQYERANIRRRGEHLYQDMSSEIHHHFGRLLQDMHFDPGVQEIAEVLVPEQDLEKGKPNWKLEIRRYLHPGNWSEDDLEMMDYDDEALEEDTDSEEEG